MALEIDDVRARGVYADDFGNQLVIDEAVAGVVFVMIVDTRRPTAPPAVCQIAADDLLDIAADILAVRNANRPCAEAREALAALGRES